MTVYNINNFRFAARLFVIKIFTFDVTFISVDERKIKLADGIIL